MFTQQHYYKLGDLVARRMAVETFEGGTKEREVVERLVGPMVVMFNEDDSKFDEEKFLIYVNKKFGEYCDLLGVQADDNVHSDSRKR